jgi:hypothetical protein
MAASDLWTYQDLVEHVLDMFDSPRSGRPLRMAKRACQEAMRELTHACQWSYFDTVHKFRTAANLTTGTVAYDHTGGAYENLLTLTDSTFPTNARLYTVILSDTHYPIARYIDSTNVLLDPDQNPGEDIAAGASYTLYRGSYPMPMDFVELGRLYDRDNNKEIHLVGADRHLADMVYYYDTPDTPFRATLRNDGEYLDALSLVFAPPASSEINYEFYYQRRPKTLVVEKLNTGTLTVSADSTTVTVVAGTITLDCIGSIVRFGTAASEPTSILGGIDDTTVSPTHTASITAVSSSLDEFTIDEAYTADLTTVKYTVSDPLDIDHGAMLTAVQRLAEAAYTRTTKRDPRERREREELALYALRDARERDNKVRNLGPRYPYDPWDGDITDDDD